MMRATFGILATLSLAATSLTAQSKPLIKVNVPFNFVAGAKTLPAGEYQVQTERPNVVLIQSKDSTSNMNLVIAHSAQNTQMNGVAALKFNRYGDRYFLSEIWTGSDLGRQLPKSRAEKEQIAAVPAHQGIVTLAAER
jgi:hypothetical protein